MELPRRRSIDTIAAEEGVDRDVAAKVQEGEMLRYRTVASEAIGVTLEELHQMSPGRVAEKLAA